MTSPRHTASSCVPSPALSDSCARDGSGARAYARGASLFPRSFLPALPSHAARGSFASLTPPASFAARASLASLASLTSVAALVSLASLAACGSDDNSVQNAADAGASADASVVPVDCDPTLDAKDAPKCVVDTFGVFVDPNGADTNPGTRALPKKTLAAALAARGQKPRLYLCEGTYPERLTLDAPVSVFAGFACGSWNYSGSKAKLAPAEKGFALVVKNLSEPIVLADLDATAKDADPAEKGASSIAAFVSTSTKVTLRRVALTAGKGAPGADGQPTPDFASPAPNGTSGDANGTATPNPLCPTSIGGKGGLDGATAGGDGVVAVSPVYPDGYTGKGGIASPTCAAGLGMDGSYGVAGTAGAGATTLGTLDANGWKGADGSKGGKGGDGQGGGGGGQSFAGGVGGSGGPGGCGGEGGAPGTAGGSSIALLSFNSSLLLELPSLSTSDAANAGNAAKGQKGQLGGTKGAATPGGNACDGGLGGVGGSGGGGGGGAGGLSVGILYKGNAPSIDGAPTPALDSHPAIKLGQKGAAGSKGAGGDAARTNLPTSRAGDPGTDGIPGDAKAVLSLP